MRREMKMNLSRIKLTVAAACVLASCTFSPKVPNGSVICQVSGDCPSGYSCESVAQLNGAVSVCCRSQNCTASLTSDQITKIGTAAGLSGPDGGPAASGADARDGLATTGDASATFDVVQGALDDGGSKRPDSATSDAFSDVPQGTAPDAPFGVDARADLGTATGGTSGAGGTTSTGGTTGAGGTTSAGGTINKGGTTSAGGTTSVGGTTSAGGTTSSGGTTSAGGTTSTGGGIPSGYPMPSAQTLGVKCTSIPGDTHACVGQPAGNTCVQCRFGGTDYNSDPNAPTQTATDEAGNYLVTVQLGGGLVGDTYISAESSRGLLKSVTTDIGQTLTYAFVVNVRAMEGQPHYSTGPGGYPGLDLFFSGKNPQIAGIGYALQTTAETKPIMVYIASDSTACDQTGGALGGWGQMLPEFFAPPVGIANYANSGASSAAFYGSSDLWGAIKGKWTPGDWVLIDFGYNDKGVEDSTVQLNLAMYLNDAKTAGVNAILISPPARTKTIPILATDLTGTSGIHAAAAAAAAATANPAVPFIDLTALSTTWYDSLGSLAAAQQYRVTEANTTLAGAEKLAGFIAQALKDQNISLAQYLR